MTPEEVRRAVPPGPRLNLDLTGLTGLAPFFTGFFPGGRLVLDPVTGRDEGPGVLTVTGTGASGPFTGMTVSVAFTGVAGGVTATARATGGPGWTFAHAFPVLGSSSFAPVTFSRSELLLGAVEMTFSGQLLSTGTVVLDLLVAAGSGAVTGQVLVTAGYGDTRVPTVLLDGPSGLTLDLGMFTLSGVGYQLGTTPVYSEAFHDLRPRSTIALFGTIPITVAGTERHVDFGAEIGSGDDLLFWGDFSGLGALDLADVAAFAGQDSLPTPFGVEISTQVILTEVKVLVRPAVPAVDHVSVTVQTQEHWQIVPDLLLLEQIDVMFQVRNPLSAPVVSGVVMGLFGIGKEGALELGVGFGSSWIGGGLREGDGPLNLTEVFAHFLGEGHPPVPELVVDKLDFMLSHPESDAGLTYRGELEISGDWQVTDRVGMTDLTVELSETDFDLRASFYLGDLGLFVRATHGAASGWSFAGGSVPGDQAPIGGLLAGLAEMFGAVAIPGPLAQLALHDVEVSYTSGTDRMFVTGAATFPIDSAKLDLALTYDSTEPSFDSVLTVVVDAFEAEFTLSFTETAASPLYAAVYRHVAGAAPEVKVLVGAIVPSAAAYVPAGLLVDVRDAFVASNGTANVVGTDLDLTVDLSKLPVVGDRLDLGVMGVAPLRLVALSAALTAAQVTELNTLPIPALPVRDLPAGFLVDGLLRLGTFEAPVTLPVTGPPTTVPGVVGPGPQASGTATWYKVQRAFGPVSIDRVGIAYQHGTDARLAVLVDASISAGGLVLSCDGLSAGVSLSDPTALPTFDLAGLGVSYTGGPVTVSGAFLKSTVVYEGKNLPAYSGKAVIETEAFTIGALGSYMQLPEGPSLFVYAFLDYPIGGPAFFFVEGIAAGFGYNRRIIAPPVEKLADFPLVAEALHTVVPGTPATELSRLEDDLPPSPGDFFLAAGVHFTSFKMIDSFLLVTAQFGHRFEMNVLGLSTLVLPVPDTGQGNVTPVAEIQLALKATFAPDDGYFSLLAQLTSNSYLLSRACRLTGGFAFVTWFGDENPGDFVLSVGGYHPHFTVPPHYPAVPRLGFTWQVTPQLSMKGSAYYALTPGALMAGAALSAVYEDGSLRAWFDAAMDFLIAWQPYHYEAGLRISVGASYTFTFFGAHTITAHIGTDVRFWGPEFGGTATIDLDVISFTINFGSQGGASAQPVPWSRFSTAQLPAAADTVTVVLRGGSPKDASGTYLGTVNPAELELLTDSAMPATSGASAGMTLATTGAAPFGIAPVGAAPGTFTSAQTILIMRGKDTANSSFRFEPVGKSLPAALWGDQLTPSLSKPALRGNLLTGYVVRPNPPQEPATTQSLPLSVLNAATSLSSEPAFSWTAPPKFTRTADQTLNLTAGAQARSAIAGKLLPGLRIDLNGLAPADFLQAPEVGANG